MKQWFLVIVAALVGLVGVQQAAASPYSGGSSSATVSDPTPAPGQTVTVSGAGFAPNSTVTVVLDPGAAGLGSATASGAGAVSASVVIPASASGTRTIVLSGTASNGSPLSLSVAVNIGGAADDIPTTGSDVMQTVVLAVGAIAAGAFLWVAAARRRRPSVAS